MPSSPTVPPADVAAVRELAAAHERLSEQIGKCVIGQKAVVEQLLLALFSRGHCLLVGVPGLAKTLLVSTVAKSLSLSFHRIQFTPDLMPADITGTDILQDDPQQPGRRMFVFLPGPVFANLLLADEINRTPPKTQAALLEAMQEGHVTAGGQRYALPEPFFVLATQNPIEQEGTYPLPEAQLDRFMLQIRLDYPSRLEEIGIMKATTGTARPEPQPVLDAKQILRFQEVVRQIVVGDHIYGYVADLVRATRPKEPGSPKWLPDLVSWGAGPRASQYLILAAKARAVMHGRVHVTTDDIRQVAPPVLRHRLMTTFHADAEGVTTDDIVAKLLASVPSPADEAKSRKL
jgi:MoxR-like ATPase